jgi:HAD superfamily hydrolase (TIGR01509 family)
MCEAPPNGKYSQDARHHRSGPVSTAILDIDGTLVDTNYHHTIAWARALQRFDIDVALWRIHRHIGMGGDQVVTSLCGQEVEDEHGDDIRSAESEEYMRLIGEVRPMEGARDLIIALRERGHSVVLASSAKEDEVDVYLDLLDARGVVDAWTTSADVESTKPAPDLVQAALEKTGDEPSEAVMVGDTPWDVQAAEKAGVETITVITGGFSEQQLTEAGAVAVFESVAELLERLDETRLKGDR